MLWESPREVAMERTLRACGIAVLLGSLSCAPAADTADTADTGDTGDTGDTAVEIVETVVSSVSAAPLAEAPRRRASHRSPWAGLGDLLAELRGESQPEAPAQGPTREGGARISSAEDLGSLVGVGRLTGDLTISGTSLRDLRGLESLRVVEGSLRIDDNPQLLSLAGLEGLESVGVELILVNNEALRDIGALGTLRSIGAERGWCGDGHAPALAAFHNDLASLEPLRGLEEVNGPVNLHDNGDLSVEAQRAFAEALPAWPCAVVGPVTQPPGLLHHTERPEPIGDPQPDRAHRWDDEAQTFEYVFD
jgi:hypothetical protein